MTNEERNQAYAEQLANRRAANCYDVHEAAQAIALQLGLNEYNAQKLLDDMGQAAFDGALVVRSPRGHDQYAPTSPPKTTYGFDSLTTPDDVNQWATKRRFTWRWLSEPQATTPSPAPVVAVGASGGDEPWKEQARARAYEIIKRDKEKDFYPSQVDIADEIAKQFRTAGLTGADGKPLAGAYIKRHALNGISSAQSKLVSTVMRQSK